MFLLVIFLVLGFVVNCSIINKVKSNKLIQESIVKVIPHTIFVVSLTSVLIFWISLL